MLRESEIIMRCTTALVSILATTILVFGSCCDVYGNDSDKIVTNVKDATKQAGQMQKIRRFWVVRPCAIEWSKDDPSAGEMFVGYSTPWYRFLVPNRIKRVGWNDWAITGITQFGVTKDNVIYGETKDEKWFIARAGDGSLPVFFRDRIAWLQELTKHGAGDTPELIDIPQGYHDAEQKLWIGRIASCAFLAGIVSLPWMIARYLRLRKKVKKRFK